MNTGLPSFSKYPLHPEQNSSEQLLKNHRFGSVEVPKDGLLHGIILCENLMAAAVLILPRYFC